MKVANIWDLPVITDVEYTGDIKRLQYLIRTGKIKSFEIKDKYDANNVPNSTFEHGLKEEGISVNYVSDDHPILISNNPILTNYISPSFYEEHKKEIQDAYYKYFRSKDDDFYNIYPYQYSPRLLNLIIRKRPTGLFFYNVDLSSDDIKKLNDNYIRATLYKDGEDIEISSDIAFANHSYNYLKESTMIDLDVSYIKGSNLNSIKFINDNTQIDITNRMGMDEEESLKITKSLLDRLSKTGKHYKVRIPVDRRVLFNSIIGKEEYNNIDITIINDLYNYSFNEYKDEEKILDDLVKPIIEANLSPLERYIAVYNIVKNYKPYKESFVEGEEPSYLGSVESRYLRYILNNEYIVCVGFAKLLQTLCERVGIRVQQASVDVDTSYDHGYTQEEKKVNQNGHQRCYVSIDDDKYGVHGIYVADPTWDNDLSMNKLSHALMTYTKVTTSNRMIWYDCFKPTLDIYSMDDFNKQINYIYRKRYGIIKENITNVINEYLTFEERIAILNNPKLEEKIVEKYVIIHTYKEVIESVLEQVKCDDGTKKFNKKLSTCQNEKDYINLLTNIGHYLLTRVNQPISNETIIQASVNGTSKLKGLTPEEKEIEYNNTRKQFYDDELVHFPYSVDKIDNNRWTRR